ncbi:hypothetical protein ADUPG1_000813, partial [Aduncisulcus paluster]
HQGGSASQVKITPEERSTAVRSAKIMGLGFCGVDILRSNHGPVVMEVNSSPGLEGIEKTTDIDVAGKLIDYIEKMLSPEKPRPKVKASIPHTKLKDLPLFRSRSFFIQCNSYWLPSLLRIKLFP